MTFAAPTKCLRDIGEIEKYSAVIITKGAYMTKRSYETPVLIKREKLDRIAADCPVSNCQV